MFNPTVIPPENNTPQQRAAHLELYGKSQDVWRVHNPTDEDYTVYNDRKMTNEHYTIPNKNRDVGFGPGNLDVRWYIAEMYAKNMLVKIISDISKKDWEVKKMQFRFDERGQKEELLAIRVNDQKLIDEWTPKILLGIVSRYQSNQLDDVEPVEPKRPSGSFVEDALDRLNLKDKLIETNTVDENIESKKKNLISQLT